MRASEIGTTPLAPTAVTTRAATNAPAPPTAAVAAASTTNAMSDPRMTRARPTRSDSGPHTSVIAP